MDNLRKKLNSTRGETLIETLAAILVAALSVALLVGAVTVSGQINRQAQVSDEDFYEQLTAAEAQTSPDDAAFQVTIREEGKTDAHIGARLYGGDDLYAYSRASSPAGEEAAP